MLDIQRVDLPAIIAATIEESVIPTTAATKDIRLTSAFSSVDGVIMGDRNRIQQIVWNLLANAVKFTPKGGRIHTVIEKNKFSYGNFPRLDTGVGIPPEFLGRIFDRFSQADASTTRRHENLGLGLAIVKQLVELHGGTRSMRKVKEPVRVPHL